MDTYREREINIPLSDRVITLTQEELLRAETEGFSEDDAHVIVRRHYYGHFSLEWFMHWFETANAYEIENFTDSIGLEQFETMCLCMNLQYDTSYMSLFSSYYEFALSHATLQVPTFDRVSIIIKELTDFGLMLLTLV